MTAPAPSRLPPPGSLVVERPRTYRSWIWAGAILIALGVLSIIAWIVYGVIEIDRTVDDMVRAPEGGVTEFAVESPRSWTVYVEPQSADLGGLRFSIHDQAGERVDMQPYGGDLSYSVTGHSGRAVATISLASGDHRLVVEGSGTRSVAIGSSVGGRIVWILVGSLLIGIPMIGGGSALLIVGALRQSRVRNRMATTPPPSAWSTGEWPTGGPGGSAH